MTLNRISSHPRGLCGVVKPRHGSQPPQGRLAGLLEHVGTGEAITFADTQAYRTAGDAP